MKKNISKEIEDVIRKNDLVLIDRERVSNIRTIQVTDLVKDLTDLFKSKEK